MATPTQVQQQRMTAAEFRKLPESNQIIELIHGEIIMSPSPISIHQLTVGDLYQLIVRHAPQTGQTLLAPMDVQLTDTVVVQPDIFWRSFDGSCVERDYRYFGPPELVVEIFSPSTSSRDRGAKFELYRDHGVREYWMVDPAGANIEIWQQRDETWTRMGIYVEGDTVESVALGTTVAFKGVFAQAESDDPTTANADASATDDDS